jgi:hypothetical protein
MNNKNEGGYISLTTHELGINEARNSNYSKNNRRRNNNNNGYAASGGRQTNRTNHKNHLTQSNKEANGNRATSYDERTAGRTAAQKFNKNRNSSAKSKKVEKLVPPSAKGVISKTTKFKAATVAEDKENKAFRLK